MAQTHWYARSLPNLAAAVCAFALALVFWSAGAKTPEPFAAGALVGVLDGILGLLARRQTLAHLRNAESFGAVIVAHMQSPWTRARHIVDVVALIVVGVLLIPRLDQPVHYSVMTLFASFAAIESTLKALSLASTSRSIGWPSDTSLERTRDR
jgi:hypothetical protein